MTYKKRRAAAWVLAASAWASTAADFSVAHAESAALNCGDMRGYQRGSPWPAFKGCATRISQASSIGAAAVNFASSQTWNVSLPGKGGSPVIAADGTVYVNAGSMLFATNSIGAKKWEVNVGGDTLSGLAIASDGTVYLGAGSNLVAVNPNGTIKWKHAAGFGSMIITAPLIAPNGTIYFADNFAGTTGSVYAVSPSNQRLWSEGFGPVSASLAMSPGGSVLYAGNQLGGLRALKAANGATLWNSDVSFGATGTPAVGSDGILYVGGTNGRLYAINHLDGKKLWEVNLGSPVIGSPALGRRGTIFVATAGNVLSTGSLFAIDPAITSTKTWLWKVDLRAYVAGSPIVDGDDSIYIGLVDHTFRSYTSSGAERWRRSTNDQIISTPAISASGAVVFGSSDQQLYSIHDGRSTERKPVGESYPRTPVTTTIENYCNNATPALAGQKRTGVVDYSLVSLPNAPSQHYITNFRLLAEPVDPNCGAHLCDEDERRLTTTQEAALFSDGLQKNVFPTAMMSLPSFLVQPECQAVEKRPSCGYKPATVNWTTTCAASGTNSCGADQRCVSVCPKIGGTGTDKNYPGRECDPSEETFHCIQTETKNCTGMSGPTHDDPYRPDISACMELRECARSSDQLAADDIEPLCSSGTCNLKAPAPKQVVKPADPPVFPAIGLWSDISPTAMCTVEQKEKANQPNIPGGETGTSGGNKKPTKPKKWGVTATAGIDTSFDLAAKPGQAFDPKVMGKGTITFGGMAMGKSIQVFHLNAFADINPCSVGAQATAKLFGETIASGDAAPPNFGPTSDAGKACKSIAEQAQKVTGEVKEAMVHASRMYSYVIANKDGNGNPIVTLAMCQAAQKIDASILCSSSTTVSATVKADNAAKVINAFTKKYTDTLALADTKYQDQVGEATKFFTDYAKTAGFDGLSGDIGIKKSISFGDVGGQFEIGAAEAHFPIGPVDLLLAIEGLGGWGIEGNLDYGLTMMSGGTAKPAFNVGASVTPHGRLGIDAFVGAGFDFGIGGAHAGFGSDVTLLDMRVPLMAGAKVGVSSQEKYNDTRGLSTTDFGTALAGRGQIAADKRPSVLTRRQKWGMSGTMGAGAKFDILYGTVDGRLRVRFCWFSKTWKKRVASFDPVATFYRNWSGSIDAGGKVTGLNLGDFNPGGLVDAVQALPLPNIPTVYRTDLTLFKDPTKFNWSGVSNPQTQKLAAAKWACNPPDPIIQ